MNICCQTTRAGGLWAVAVGTDIQRSSFVYMTNSICQRLYDSEINFTISCFWDDGFVVMLGDSMNDYVAQTSVRTWEQAEQWLRSAAMLHFPDSQFAKDERSNVTA